MTISTNVQSSFPSNIFRGKNTNRPTFGDFCGGGSNHMTANFKFCFHMDWFFIIKNFYTDMVFILIRVNAFDKLGKFYKTKLMFSTTPPRKSSGATTK